MPRCLPGTHAPIVRADKAGALPLTPAGAGKTMAIMWKRLPRLLHLVLALWGLVTCFRLLNRSRVVPVALVVGPWREVVYPPWLLFCMGLCAVVVVWRTIQLVVELVGAVPGHNRPKIESPSEAAQKFEAEGSVENGHPQETVPQTGDPVSTRANPLAWGWPDWAALAATGIMAWTVLQAFRARRNPLGVCVGMDAPTFLGDIVAIGIGRWDLYNTDKRLPYPFLSAKVADITGWTYLEAGQAVSFASAVLLVIVVYVIARAFSGRLTALLAALTHLAFPVLHPYAVQTTSYSFFYLVVNVTVAASAWAVVTGHPIWYLLAGLGATVSVATQVKGLTVVVPVLGIVLVATVVVWRRASVRLVSLAALPILVGTVTSSFLPVEYTPLSWLIAHHREEVHQDMPYPWTHTVTPPLDAPSPLSPWLPSFLRGGELEALSGALLAPADSEVVLFRKQGTGTRVASTPVLLPGTTIPPLGVRLSNNIKALQQFLPENVLLLASLLALGLLGAILPLPRGLPPKRAAAGWVLLAALLSVWGSLSLKFHIRYLLQALPVVSILIVHAVQIVARQWTGRSPGWVRGITGALVAWLIASLAASLFCHSTRTWLDSPARLARLPQCLGIHDQENNIVQAWAVMRTAAWIDAHVPLDASVLDCSPIPVWHYLPGDPRFVRPVVDGQRFKACQRFIARVNAGERPERETYIVVSDVPEYRGPDTPYSHQLLSHPDRWTMAFGFNPENGQALDASSPFHPTRNAMLVFRTSP